MRQEVVVRFAEGAEFTLPVLAGEAMGAEAGRRWLDEQFVANDCEPLRATGKVLMVDKVLALASTVGARRFAEDGEWGLAFARAVLGALGRATVQVGVDTRTVTY